MNGKKLFALLVIVTAGVFLTVFSSCTTLQQDVVVSSVQKDEIKEIGNFEFRLAYLDSADINPQEAGQSDVQEKNAGCERLISEINGVLKNSDLVLAAQARLIALKGRVYFILHNESKAKECYLMAEEKYKGDIQNFILAHRLSLIDDLTSRTIPNSEKPLILIEQAIDAYKAKDYLSAVAKFDEAFISSENFYKDAYRALRDDAWNKRSLQESSQTSSLLEKSELTIGQMMLMTQNYPNIIDYYTAGNRFGEAALFKKLVQKGLITSATQIQPPQRTYAYTKLTRSMQARFLWNIFCDKKNKPDLRTKYSTAYSKLNAESPVKDVLLSDEDFDAILGCVEFDIMELSDGINFNPHNSVSGIEFDKALQKLNK